MRAAFGALALVALPNEISLASARQATAIEDRAASAPAGFLGAFGGSPTGTSGATLSLVPDSTSAVPRIIMRTAGDVRSGTEAPGRKIAEAKRLSGLTWEELSTCMGVSRRTLHLWANGRPIGAANEERLGRLLAAIRAVDRGTARATRSVILSPLGPDARLPLDFLAQAQFDEFVTLVARGRGRAKGPSLALSATSRAARTPPPPLQLLEALQDEVETDARAHIPGKAIRRPVRQT